MLSKYSLDDASACMQVSRLKMFVFVVYLSYMSDIQTVFLDFCTCTCQCSANSFQMIHPAAGAKDNSCLVQRLESASSTDDNNLQLFDETFILHGPF